MEREVGGGMTTTIGRVEKEELFDHGISILAICANHSSVFGQIGSVSIIIYK